MNSESIQYSMNVLHDIVQKMSIASGIKLIGVDTFLTFDGMTCLQFYTDGYTFDQVQELTEDIYDLWCDDPAHTDDVHFVISRK